MTASGGSQSQKQSPFTYHLGGDFENGKTIGQPDVAFFLLPITFAHRGGKKTGPKYFLGTPDVGISAGGSASTTLPAVCAFRLQEDGGHGPSPGFGEEQGANLPFAYKNMVYFPLLVLQGTYHYRIFFSWHLNQMEGTCSTYLVFWFEVKHCLDRSKSYATPMYRSFGDS